MPRPVGGREAERSECNRPRTFRDPDFCFLGCYLNLPVGPSGIGRGWDGFLASAFNSLASPHSQPWHLVLAAGPGLLSLGEKAWQRHPTWGESDKGEAGRRRQKVREAGLFLELVE